MSLYKIWNKVRVFFGFKRKLHGKWTVEKITELEAMYGLDAEEELAKVLSEEIDKELIKEHGPNWKQEQYDTIITGLLKIADDQNKRKIAEANGQIDNDKG